MIDSHTPDFTGWARFSDDRVYRYRLARALTPRAAGVLGSFLDNAKSHDLRRVAFVMLNPSTADAFKPDPTVKRCVAFAQRWGADVLEVVNLFALRSPCPRDLVMCYQTGADDPENDREILAACTGAARVIVAWGNDGKLYDRDAAVTGMLQRAGIKLEALRLSPKSHAPMHPLARGKNRIPDDVEPIAW